MCVYCVRCLGTSHHDDAQKLHYCLLFSFIGLFPFLKSKMYSDRLPRYSSLVLRLSVSVCMPVSIMRFHTHSCLQSFVQFDVRKGGDIYSVLLIILKHVVLPTVVYLYSNTYGCVNDTHTQCVCVCVHNAHRRIFMYRSTIILDCMHARSTICTR